LSYRYKEDIPIFYACHLLCLKTTRPLDEEDGKESPTQRTNTERERSLVVSGKTHSRFFSGIGAVLEENS
jgi:hypothetical protein